MRGQTALGIMILTVAWQLNVASARPDNALVGPLFYTPLERDAIDRGNLATDGESGDQSHSELSPPEVLRFDGRVERSGGPTTAWVSGRPLERLQPVLPDARLRLQGERLRIETREATRWLKAGEQFEPVQPTAPDTTPDTAEDLAGAVSDMGPAQ